MPLEDQLGYFFFDKSHLRQALTHSSYGLEDPNPDPKQAQLPDQSAYGLLGSAVLDAVLTELLIRSGHTAQQAIVARKVELKQIEKLAELSQTVGAGYVLKLGHRAKQQQAYDNPMILAETLEAVVGAVYFDGGFSAARRVVQKLFRAEFDLD